MSRALGGSLSRSPFSLPTAKSKSKADPNGKEGLHGGCLESLRRWLLARRGGTKVATTAGLIALIIILLLQPGSVLRGIISSSTASLRTRAKKNSQRIHIPACPAAPWREPEILQGLCPGDLRPFEGATTIAECASTCCNNPECISWQFRDDVGCKQGGDVRIGMEKDGVPAWCDSHPPQKWSGQFLYPKGKTEGMDAEKLRKDGCSMETWNPHDEIGQCFGLGAKREHASGSAQECMEACCAEEDQRCGVWQWSKDIGCFYGKSAHGCKGDGGDPIQFEPFVGKRKRLEGRTYTDNKGEPWSMKMPE